MSIFSKLRRAKQAADTQKDKKTAEAESKPKPVPYKHIPTHAATDALLGAPATWREADKKAIQAQRKRSQHQLQRNPSSLSNVMTLNRNQSFSTDRSHSAIDQRKNYSADRAPSTGAPRKSHVTPRGWSPTTNFSRTNQLPHQERPSAHADVRRSHFDTTEPVPPLPIATEGQNEFSKSSMAPSYGAKSYLSPGEEISPGQSDDNSNPSSGDSSFYEPFVPARHSRRMKPHEPAGRRVDDQNSFPQTPKHRNRKIGEGPRLSAVPSTPDASPPANPTAHTENDFSFIDFEGASSHHSRYPVTAF